MAEKVKQNDTIADHVSKAISVCPEKKAELIACLSASSFTYQDGKPCVQFGKNATWAWERSFILLPELRRAFGESVQILPRKPEKKPIDRIIAERMLSDIRMQYRAIIGKHTDEWGKWFRYHKPNIHPLAEEVAASLDGAMDKAEFIKNVMPDLVRKRKAEIDIKYENFNKPIERVNILDDLSF